LNGLPAPEARLQLTCRGVVQGVGARPALRHLAARLGLRGQLRNHLGVLGIDLRGPRLALEEFLAALPGALPEAARLDRLEARWLEAPAEPWPEELAIAAESATPLGGSPLAPGLSADRAPCPRCLEELADPASRRYRYPFISCCACGPRYSVATALPFCRAHTTYAAFPPCPACEREFRDPADRRFHAETISCPTCGPRLRLRDGAGRGLAEGEEALLAACRLLLEGGIVALQGVGGFQLLVDASQSQAVARLRERKRRPAKPFALLVAEPGQLESVVRMSAAEERALRHPAAPIVLLRRRFPHPDASWEAVAPGGPALGVMLPASGLHHLLAREVARPLVATSGNRSGEPLCVAPEEAIERLAGIADAFLAHTLPIARPLDDSILRVIDGRPALVRRARGLAPEPLPWRGPDRPSPAGGVEGGALLALGGDGKAAPALVTGDQLWLAPHFGDLSDAAVASRWQGAMDEQLISPSVAVRALACDAHPGYRSHHWAQGVAWGERLPLTAVPHHLAHGLAVLAEWGLRPPLLVVAWDGLGLADPALPEAVERLWGGELLLVREVGAEGLGWERLAASRPFPLPGGERAMGEPRRCALGLLSAAGPWALAHPGARQALEAFSARELQWLGRAIESGCNAPLTSSLGRLVDGVASLLGLARTLSFEGEGGMRWERAAAEAAAAAAEMALVETAAEAWLWPLRPSPSEPSAPPLGRWDWEPLLRALLEDQAAGGCPKRAAWRVERALVEGMARGVEQAASWSGCAQVALTGGCFQNRALLEGSVQELRRRGLEPLWGERVPCNDGGLALGQAWAAQAGGLGL
jgi:hydrogenase maturation protein HypF